MQTTHNCTPVVNDTTQNFMLPIDEEYLKMIRNHTNEELAFLHKIFEHISKIKTHTKNILDTNITNDKNKQQFIIDIQSLHNQTIQYARYFRNMEIWKNCTGKEIYYRISPFGKKIKITSDDDIINLFNISIQFYDTIENVYLYDNTLVLVKSLLNCTTEVFNPLLTSEFITYNNINYRNTFQYTNHLKKTDLLFEKNRLETQKDTLQGKFSCQNAALPDLTHYLQPSKYYFQQSIPNMISYQEDKEIQNKTQQFANIMAQLQYKESFILEFIRELSQNEYQFKYILQWLAHFFQTLHNSKMALVLIGDKKTTDTLVNEIIKPIFALKDEYFSLINDETLKKTNEYLLNDKIFYHFDNLSESSTKNTKTSEIIFEIFNVKTSYNLEKYENGGVLITSNKDTPYPFLKDIYNICSVFRVKHLDTILKKMDISRITLNDAIEDDLNNFCTYLAQHQFSQEGYYYTNTPEKKALPFMKNGLLKTNELDIQITEFISAIKNKEVDYFCNIENEDSDLYQELKVNFDENMIAQPLLITPPINRANFIS